MALPQVAQEEVSRSNRERESRCSLLAVGYRTGDRVALAKLYLAMEGAIAFVLQPYLSDPSLLPPCVDVDDLWQQAFVALSETVLEWQPERSGNFIPYFFSSFPGRIDHYVRAQTPARRTSRVHLFSMPHDLLLRQMVAIAGLDGRNWDDLLACAEAMDRLPAKYARVVWLHIFREMSFAEVGKRLGMGRSAAHETFGRALALLRSSMGISQP